MESTPTEPQHAARARRAIVGIGATLFLCMALVIAFEVISLRGARSGTARSKATPVAGSVQDAGTPEPGNTPTSAVPSLETLSLEQKVGQLLLIGVPRDWEPGADDIVSRVLPGGVILLDHNVRSLPQVTALTCDLRRCVLGAGAPQPLIAVEHEGRETSYLRKLSLTSFPSNAELGREKNVDAVRDKAEIIAGELRSIGVDMTLAPVLDVLAGPDRAGLGDRSFGADPEVCADLGAAYVETASEHGLIACAKHWPGFGPVVSQEASLPVASVSADEWRKVHRVPFVKAIQAGVRCIRTAEAAYPSLDASGVAAGLSPVIVGGLLRAELGFEGVVISHDLDADPAASEGVPEAAVRALTAGVDMVMIAGEPETQLKTFERLLQAVQTGELTEIRINRSVERILELKRFKMEPQQTPSPTSSPD